MIADVTTGTFPGGGMARARAAAFFMPLIRSDFDNALEEGGGVTGAHAPWIMALAGSGRWRGREKSCREGETDAACRLGDTGCDFEKP
jgi:hypothetical protein